MLVLLDRDGVLNVDRPESVRDPSAFVPIAGSAAAVARLNRAGHRVAVVTNQSGIGRGWFDTAMLERIHDRLRAALAAEGAHLDLLLHCPDPPWAAGPDRKPAPGMLRTAMARLGIGPAETVMIGDSLGDLQAAARAGCARILVRTGKGRRTQADGLPADVLPVRVFDDLAAAVAALLDGAGGGRTADAPATDTGRFAGPSG